MKNMLQLELINVNLSPIGTQFKFSLVFVDICNYDLIENSASYEEEQEQQEYEI